MGFLSRLFERRASPSSISPASVPVSQSFGWADIKKNPTVIASVNVIANSISILPLNLFFRNPKTGARQKAGWHPLYTVLRRRPNSAESPTAFVAKLLRHILQSGNAYLFKGKSGGQVVSLRLLNPDAVRVVEDRGVLVYAYNGVNYSDQDILHIPSLITDDWGRGYSPVELARVAVALGIQLDEYSLSAFGNGLNTKLLLDIADMTVGVKDQDQAQKIASTVSDYVRRNYSGADNAGKPLVLWSGMKAQELTGQSSNAEAQLLEMRKYQELEICKIFGVPPFLINGTYDVKYGGLEQAMTVFSNFTLGPYLRHIEQRLNTLLDPYEQDAYYFEFDLTVLLRPDEKSRAEFYSKLFNMGVLSPGQIAAKENIDPPDEGADARFVPANMMPLRQDVLDAYMAGAKQKAEELVSGQPAPDPSLASGSQAQ